MSFEIRFNEEPAILWIFGEGEKEWANIKKEKKHNLSEPSKLDIDLDTSFIDNSSLDVLILKPLPDLKDFTIVYSKVNKVLFGRTISSRNDQIAGLRYSEIVGKVADLLNPLFTRVYTTKKTGIFEVVSYNDDILIENLKVEVIYNNGYLTLLHVDETENILRNQENSLLHTQHDKRQVTLFTIGIDGVYYWKPEIYDIINRAPEDKDTSYNILKDLMSNEDAERLTALEEGEIDEKLIIDIETENGDKKVLQFYATPSFDTFGNYRFMLIYVIDLTPEFLEKQDNIILDKLVSKMNTHFGTGNFVISPDRGTLFTPEVANVTNLYYCHDYVDELQFRKFYGDVSSSFILQEFRKKIIDDGDYDLQIEKLYSGEIDRMDCVFDYNFEEGEELRRLHYILQKEIIDGNTYFIGGVQDITKEYNREKELIDVNNNLGLLIKESNHRIKNNLNILLKSISLEKRVNKGNWEEIINKMELRIKSMDLFHSLLYQGPTSEEVFIVEYFKDFADKICDVYPTSKKITFTIENNEDFMISADKIMPLSLMANELITNTLKYAYEDFDIENKEIHTDIYQNNNYCEIFYRDNGLGLPEDFDPKSSTGLGWVIVNSLVEQLNGDYEVYNDEGMCFRLTFPLN